MRDGKQGRVPEFVADGPPDERIGRHVDGAGGLVEHHDLGARNDGTREAEQLALALGEVLATLRDGRVEVREDTDILGRRGAGRRERG